MDYPPTRLFNLLDMLRVRSYSLDMRYSPEHKAETHEKILSMAARSFREHGGDSSGVGKVMKKAGLTKGGFYRHFQSKDDLFVQAVARAFDELGTNLLEAAQSAPEWSGSPGHHRALSERSSREFAGSGLCALRPRTRARTKTSARPKAD